MPKIGEAPLRVLGSPPDRPRAGFPPVFALGDRPDRRLPVGALTNVSNSDTFTRKGANAFSVMKGVQRHERIAGYLA